MNTTTDWRDWLVGGLLLAAIIASCVVGHHLVSYGLI